MKIKTYGIYNLTEWHGKVKAGTIEVNVSFTGGTASPSGTQPAYMVTKDPITQFVIENSKEFKDGLICIVLEQEIEGTHRRMAVPKPANTFAPSEETGTGRPAGEAAGTGAGTSVDAQGTVTYGPAGDASGTVTVVEVTDIDEARDYLVDKFGIARSTIRYKSNVLKEAEERKVKFVGLDEE